MNKNLVHHAHVILKIKIRLQPYIGRNMPSVPQKLPDIKQSEKYFVVEAIKLNFH